MSVRTGLRNIGHWTLLKIWVGTFLVGHTLQRNDYELILTVK